MDFLTLASRFGVALGIGLIIGAERERHKHLQPGHTPAGVRTFTLIALTGAIAGAMATAMGAVGGAILLVGVALAMTALIVVAYAREGSEEPGMTTEVAEVATLLLGMYALFEPPVAAAIAIVIAIVLVVRSPLQDFVTHTLSGQELWDALLLLAATLVVLPLLPTHAIGPLGVFVPRRIWEVAVIVMAIGGGGHIAMRTIGPRYGLPLVGLASGFVSSVATIVAMGSRSRTEPEVERSAVAGAALSSVATFAQLGVVVALGSTEVLRSLLPALLAGGVAATVYGIAFALRLPKIEPKGEHGRAFDPKAALLFAAAVTVVLFVAALAQRLLGAAGAVGAAGLVGFADTHSAAYSVSSLASTGGVPVRAAALAVLLAFSTNSITKAVAAWTAGGRRFFARVAPGLALSLAAAWAGAIAVGLP